MPGTVGNLRLFGVPIRLHFTFLLLLVFLIFIGIGGQQSGLTTAVYVLALFASVLLHEIGHALVARAYGVRTLEIVMYPIGGVSRLEGQPKPQQEPLIALAGPAVNLIIGVALLATQNDFLPLEKLTVPTDANLIERIGVGNVLLGVFNLLPAYPMDGGRVLRAVFSRRTDMVQATQRAVRIGHVFSIMFMMVGMLMSNWWLVMIGFFLFVGAQLEERSAVFQSVLQSVRLEEVMLTDFATLSPADTLEDALEKAVHTLQDDFPVVRGSDMVGVVSKQKILEALRSEGNGYVQAVMNRIFEVAARQESLASAFRKLSANNLSIIPVVDEQHLVGIVTLQNLMHSMSLLAESRKLRREALDS